MALADANIKTSVTAPVKAEDKVRMYLCVSDSTNDVELDAEQLRFVSDVANVIQSIMQERISKDSLSYSYEVLKEILGSIDSGIMVYDRQTKEVLFENDIVKNCNDIKRVIQTCVTFYFTGENIKSIQEHCDAQSGLWYEVRFSDLTWLNGNAAIVCTAVDVTQKKKNQQKIEYQAHNDFLTGLYNRMKCENDLRHIVRKAVRDKEKGAVLFMDLDDFKHINDGLGHQYGDVLLQQVAAPMQIISQFVPLPLADPAQGTAVAMGYFDGIHIGHRAVIDGAVQWARAHGAAPAVFTFRLPVDNKMKGKRLLSSADKHALIASLGVEYYLTPDFEEIKGLSPEQFVRSIVENCHAKALFCGENFTFGAKAAGTPELLRKLCAPLGVEVVVVPMAQFEEKPVSSTRIRTALEGGDIPAANAMLGMPYAIRFAVQHGAGLGHTLGVPTINQLYPQGFQMPRSGIYITRTLVNGTWYPSATGLGSRPTVNDDATKVTCETFIPGFSGDLYGTDPVVEFHAYLSPSKKFDTLDELRDCINNAAQRAQEYFK